MRYRILLLISGICIFFSSTAQKIPTIAYAITSETKGGTQWTEVKLINMSSGEVLQNVFENKKSQYNIFDVRSGKPVNVKNEKGIITDQNKLPFPSFSAACAYDKKHNRLYYTPMRLNQLRYIDLNAGSPKIYYFENEPLSAATNLNDDANHITRMVIASDGNGYALSNDGSHLIRFTTGKKPVITDLGAVNDDPSNGSFSIRNRCTSWGGDMVADASGNLYVITAYHAVFKIDIDSRKATYISNIEGVPANFTTNGAVVDNSGGLIVTSSASAEAYYKVNMNTWKAVRIEIKDKVFNASDLGNGNFAFQNRAQTKFPALLKNTIIRNDKITVFPNPVTDGSFRVSFDNKETGSFEIQLVDLFGRVLSQKKITVKNVGQVEEIEIGQQAANGLYMVKVLNSQKKTVYLGKITLQ